MIELIFDMNLLYHSTKKSK